MKFSIDWLNLGDSRSAEIAATICSWQIDLSGVNIAKFALLDRDEAPERMITSCYPIAEGITQSWWYLFSSTGGCLSLKKYRDGFIFPNVTIEPEEDRLSVAAIPFHYENPRVNFVNAAKQSISRDEISCVFGDFVEQVIHRLQKANVHNTSLAKRWDRITRSTLDIDEKLFCEAAGAAGLDPYACADEDAKAIEEAADVFSHENLLEFLSGENAASRSPRVTNDIGFDLSWYRDESQRMGKGAALPGLQRAFDQINSDDAIEIPHTRGYLAARNFRKFIDVGAKQKLPSAAEITRRLGNEEFQYSSVRTRSLRGVVEPYAEAARVILPLIHREDSKIFALARGIGDYLMFGDTGPTPLTDTHSNRQASGRAFAAELLAPAMALRELEEDGWSEDEIAREFGVGEKVIEHQLKNLSLHQ